MDTVTGQAEQKDRQRKRTVRVEEEAGRAERQTEQDRQTERRTDDGDLHVSSPHPHSLS